MNRWRWAGPIILGILLAGPVIVSGLRRNPTEGHALKSHVAETQVMTAYQADAAPMWSPQWVDDGIPVRFRQSGRVPSVVANPANPRLTWWFWPKVEDGQVWFGLAQGRGVAWHGVSVGDRAQWSRLPVPVPATAQWVTALKSGRGPMPEMRTEPAGAFMDDRGSVTGVTGWEAGMESEPRTIIVTWGLTRQHGTGLRLITLWHWQPRSGWQCTLAVLQNEPTVQLADRGMLHGIPSRVPGWAVPPTHQFKEVEEMESVPTPEEALLLDEARAQLLGAATTLQELAEFVVTVGEQMRQHDPGLAHHPPFRDALSQFLQQRQALRMTPQSFSIQGADARFYAGLAQALGVSSDVVMPTSDEGGTRETAWFQQMRRWVAEGAVWPAVGEALETLDEEGGV